MRRHSPNSSHAFTLVELMIVVLILGILAAITVPQFSNSSVEARRNALASTVQSVRSQIDLYRIQHGGALPDLATSWAPFTGVTAHQGRSYGPYVHAPPGNATRGDATTVKNGTNILPGETYGFVYDYGAAGNGTGRFWGVRQESDGTLSLIGD